MRLPGIRRGAGAGSAPRPRRRTLTPRALVLGALVLFAVVVLASPLNHYLGSRSDVSRAAAQLHDDQVQLHRLTALKARWSDPGYIQQQARSRLEYAMPGDTVYVVVGPHERSTIERTSGTPARSRSSSDTWSTRLWDSVRAASG